MEEVKNITDVFYSSLQSLGTEMMGGAVKVIGALILMFILWLIARIIRGITIKVLSLAKFDQTAERVHVSDYLKKANIKATPTQLVGKMVYWFFMLVALLATADAMGWEVLSNEIGGLLSKLPSLFIALVFLIVGLYIAGFVRDFVRAATTSLGMSTGKMLSNLAYFALVIMVILTTLQQVMDITIITSNLFIVIGAICLAAGISYGFASKDLLSNILASFFSRKTFKVGQYIELEGVRGEIVEVSNIAVTIRINEEEKVVIPSHSLITNKVKIID